MPFVRGFVFAALEVVFLPFQIVGTLGYLFLIRFRNRRHGVSGTAYEPFMVRLLLHQIGSRSDEAAERMAPHLPALPPAVLLLLMKTMATAARWSGFRGSFFAYPGPRPSSMMTIMSHRTHFFDERLSAVVAPESPIQQFVLLGAGWDTRSYGPLPEGGDLRAVAAPLSGQGKRIFEVDEPPTQRVKVEALRRAGVDSSHVAFAPTDFNQRSWLDSLIERGFDPEQPTFILWEGVTMYLDDEAVEKTLRAVAAFAPGSRLAFDFMSRELVFARKPYVAEGLYARYAAAVVYSESWHFGISTAPPARQHAEDLMESCGLELEDFETFGSETGRRIPIGGLVLARTPKR